MQKTPNPVFSYVAENLARAQALQDEAARKLASATAERERIDNRVAQLEGNRAEIIGRRQRGEQHQDDGANLALIAADLEGLGNLIHEANAAVAAAQTEHDSAAAVVSAAQYSMQRVEDEQTEAALIKYAGELDAIMLKTLQQLAAVGERLSRSYPAWHPSGPLYTEMRRVMARLGKL